ncbi:hypothetical protein [Arthrobacter sp. Soil762]|uniref:hypothetical protein n=1 Tax=Arthrobacter sp. Soil762 TaxID=1736401 RepID=UPI001F274426|nr:hypothetical protein [Arthrobacter sp. Soil762]
MPPEVRRRNTFIAFEHLNVAAADSSYLDGDKQFIVVQLADFDLLKSGETWLFDG